MNKRPTTIRQFSDNAMMDHAIAIGFIPDRFQRMKHKDNDKFWIYLNAGLNRVGVQYRLTKWYRTEMTAVEFMALRESDALELAQYFFDSAEHAIKLKKELQAMTNQSKKDVREFVKKRYRDLTVKGIH